MELNDRKLKILQAIIKNYLETAEPVGSRTISKKYDLGVSSATIRNEMSDLEELGFIIQPYTSAGRIPSDRGYRLYVDHLMKGAQLSYEQVSIIESMIFEKVNKLDNLLKEVSELLSILTNYTSVVTSPHYKKTRLKHLQFVPLDQKSAILVIVTNENLVRNNIINTDVPLEYDKLNEFSNLLNSYLKGLTLEEINLSLIQKIKRQMGTHSEILNSVLDAVAETIQIADDIDIYTSGTTNILDFPEFNDIIKAKNVIQTLEQKDMVLSILNNNRNPATLKADICITIGQENLLDELKDCSVITTTYKIGNRNVGTVGVVGPTRMNYSNVVSTLKYVMSHVDCIFNNKYLHKRE